MTYFGVEVVEDLEDMLTAKYPDAHIWILGIDGDSDPVWEAAQQTAILTVRDGATVVVTRPVPLPYAEITAGQVRGIGMTAEITGVAMPDYEEAWVRFHGEDAGCEVRDALDDAAGEADAFARMAYGTDDLSRLDAEGRKAWHKAACEQIPGWADAVRDGHREGAA
jgi:hypothetical protein